MADIPAAAPGKKSYPWGWISLGVIIFLLIVIGTIYYYNKEFLDLPKPGGDPLHPTKHKVPNKPDTAGTD